jgi:LmbE family N-acetylglucosaminyl deacetylase
MFNLSLGSQENDVNSILFIGSHCDDIEIGCSGSVLKFVEKYPNALFYWVVLSSNTKRKKEAVDSAEYFLKDAKHKVIDICKFRNGYFPYIGAEIKDYFEDLKSKINPDIIFTHYGADYHQDHRITSELTWNTFRNHMILEYEIPKYDGGLNSPNMFIPVSEAICKTKIDSLMHFFASENNKQWFSEETFKGLMRIRGIECNSPSGYAEAFYCRKAVI